MKAMTSKLRQSAQIATLTDRALVQVRGADWRSFLQGLISQDVLTLASGELRFAGLLNPQGKLLFDLFLLGGEDGCLIDVAADRRAALVQRLCAYRLRAKVEIAAAPGAVFAIWPAPDLALTDAAVDPRLPALGARVYGPSAPLMDAMPAQAKAYHHHRLALGVPDAGLDCPSETTYPIEANFDLLAGVDFKKGCFVGQETTSRMKRRAAVRTRMVPLRFDGPAPAFGAEVLAGELRAGEVRFGLAGQAMALLRLDRIDGVDLTVEGWPVRAEIPAYMAS